MRTWGLLVNPVTKPFFRGIEWLYKKAVCLIIGHLTVPMPGHLVMCVRCGQERQR